MRLSILIVALSMLAGCGEEPAIDLDRMDLHQRDGTRVGAFSGQYPARSGLALEATVTGMPRNAAGVRWFIEVPDEGVVGEHFAERPPYRYPGAMIDEAAPGGPYQLVAEVWDGNRETVATARTTIRIVHVKSLARVAPPTGDVDRMAPLFRLLAYAQHGKSACPPAQPVGATVALPDGREVSSGSNEAQRAYEEDVKRRYGGDPWVSDESAATPGG